MRKEVLLSALTRTEREVVLIWPNTLAALCNLLFQTSSQRKHMLLVLRSCPLSTCINILELSAEGSVQGWPSKVGVCTSSPPILQKRKLGLVKVLFHFWLMVQGYSPSWGNSGQQEMNAPFFSAPSAYLHSSGSQPGNGASHSGPLFPDQLKQ